MRTLHNLHSIDIAPGEIGVTLRNGDKWAGALGETINLCECKEKRTFSDHEPGCAIVGTGAVTAIWAGKFSDLPAKLIEHEHEESSRVYSGLLSSMRRAYGDEWPEDSAVVGMTYRRES